VTFTHAAVSTPGQAWLPTACNFEIVAEIFNLVIRKKHYKWWQITQDFTVERGECGQKRTWPINQWHPLWSCMLGFADKPRNHVVNY